MRDMRHENVNTFVGASVDTGNVCVINKMCAKGSLDDILQNEDIQLDLMFKISFAMDICAVCLFFMCTIINALMLLILQICRILAMCEIKWYKTEFDTILYG